MTESTSNNLAPARVVMRAGTLGTTTEVVFEVNRPFLWASDRDYTLARGSFRLDEGFLLVDEKVRPLVFDLLGREENIGVMKLRFGMSHVGLILARWAAGDLATYVAKMRLLLTDIFGLDDKTTEVYLVTEKFGPGDTIGAIEQGWGIGAIRVTNDETLATAIRKAKAVADM